MAAYVIADIAVEDPQTYARYRKDVGATLEKFGGRFLVRGGNVQALEGDWCPTRLVVLEFPNMAALNAWYTSDEYGPLLDLRLSASTGRLIVAEGV